MQFAEPPFIKFIVLCAVGTVSGSVFCEIFVALSIQSTMPPSIQLTPPLNCSAPVIRLFACNDCRISIEFGFSSF